MLAGALLLMRTPAVSAMYPCDVWEWMEAQQTCDAFCNPEHSTPPYYCGYAWACEVDEHGQIDALCTCEFYSWNQPCPTNPG